MKLTQVTTLSNEWGGTDELTWGALCPPSYIDQLSDPLLACSENVE